MDTVISAGLPSLLILIIGFFLKSHFEDNKEFQRETKLVREKTTEKLDSIIKSSSSLAREVAVIEANLKNHVESDESVQKEMNLNINKIFDKLNN